MPGRKHYIVSRTANARTSLPHHYRTQIMKLHRKYVINYSASMSKGRREGGRVNVVLKVQMMNMRSPQANMEIRVVRVLSLWSCENGCRASKSLLWIFPRSQKIASYLFWKSGFKLDLCCFSDPLPEIIIDKMKEDMHKINWTEPIWPYLVLLFILQKLLQFCAARVLEPCEIDIKNEFSDFQGI